MIDEVSLRTAAGAAVQLLFIGALLLAVTTVAFAIYEHAVRSDRVLDDLTPEGQRQLGRDLAERRRAPK